MKLLPLFLFRVQVVFVATLNFTFILYICKSQIQSRITSVNGDAMNQTEDVQELSKDYRE